MNASVTLPHPPSSSAQSRPPPHIYVSVSCDPRQRVITRVVIEDHPVTWEDVEEAFHRAWGQAIDQDYHKADWVAFQALLDALKGVGP